MVAAIRYAIGGCIAALLTTGSSCDAGSRELPSIESPAGSVDSKEAQWACDKDPFTLFEAASANHVTAVKNIVRTCIPATEASVQDDIALQRAARSAASGSVRALLALGADPTYRDAQGFEAVAMLAIPAQHNLTPGEDQAKARLVEVLVAQGASVDQPIRDGTAPLALAAGGGLHKVAAALIRAGAEVDHQNRQGVTALMAAAMGDNPSLVRLLVTAGADLQVKDDQGMSALDHARRWARASLIDYLALRA